MLLEALLFGGIREVVKNIGFHGINQVVIWNVPRNNHGLSGTSKIVIFKN